MKRERKRNNEFMRGQGEGDEKRKEEKWNEDNKAEEKRTWKSKNKMILFFIQNIKCWIDPKIKIAVSIILRDNFGNLKWKEKFKINIWICETLTMNAVFWCIIPRGTCDVVVIVIWKRTEREGLFAFHMVLVPLGRVSIQLSSLKLWVNRKAD